MLGRLIKPARPANGAGELRPADRANGSGGQDLDATNGRSVPAPPTAIEVAGDYRWTIEVRHEDRLLGVMHSSNPFVLISFFREYTVLYGAPAGSHAVWLRHRQTGQGAPLQPLFGEAAWLEFLRRLDPLLDDHLADMQASLDRSSMIDAAGRTTYPDAIFEAAFTPELRGPAAAAAPA
jgi:hypothetical protein